MVEINIVEETEKLLEWMKKINNFMTLLNTMDVIVWLARKSDEIFLVHEQKNKKALNLILRVEGLKTINLTTYIGDMHPDIFLPDLFIIPGAKRSSEPTVGARKTKRNILLPTGKRVKFSQHATPDERVWPIGQLCSLIFLCALAARKQRFPAAFFY